MNYYLIVLTLFVLFLVGVFSVYPEIVFAKHEEGNSEDKSKSDSNNQADTTNASPPSQTPDKSQTTTTDVVPIEPPPTQTPTITSSQTCSDGSDRNNDQICTAEQTNPEQTTSTSQSTPMI
jgi:hypothetical protein